MDDGTTARLGPHHYVMTTTTAAAGNVMRHLDFVSQCVAPKLDVRFASVTEHWAQFAVAGPNSRELLNGLLDAPIDDGTFPFMACSPVTVAGVAGRLFRISFSGEHAYEVAVPSRYGERYAYGHIVEGGRHLFVSSGIGTAILPVRFLTPPELVVITLTPTGAAKQTS